MFTTSRAASAALRDAALEILNDDPMRVATDQFGCRVLQRVVETGCCPELRAWIVKNTLELSQSKYGHYLAETQLKHGETCEKVEMIRVLMTADIHQGSCCFVVKKVLDLKLNPRDVQLPSSWWNARALADQKRKEECQKNADQKKQPGVSISMIRRQQRQRRKE